MSETKVMEPSQQLAESESESQESAAKVAFEREPAPSQPLDTARHLPRRRLLPFVVTLITAAMAIVLGRAMWNAYMGAPWTRDGTVRAYIATMAPEVSGRIVELPIADNQFVHKGDMLMVIDPTNYRIAVSLAEASAHQAQASIENIDAQMSVQQAQISAAQAQVDSAQAALVFAQQQAGRYQAMAQTGIGSVQNAQQFASGLRQQEAAVKAALQNLNLAQRQVESLKAQRMGAEASVEQAEAHLHQAQVDLERTRILSPVDGYVTNLLARHGDYANVGVNVVSVVDANSFWVDGYFEETNFGSIQVGDAADIKLMGYSEIVRGHVESISHAINVANAQPNGQGVATVNPIFTWVRLAQRIPVRIQIDHVPEGIVLAAGMTATVQIDVSPR